MKEVTEEYLLEVFERIWCRETSAFPEEWSPDNPALGQCLSTARITRSCLGGTIIKCLMDWKWPHFYNVLPDGCSLDLAASGLSPGMVETCPRETSIIELDNWGKFFPKISQRHALLKAKFTQATGIVPID
jgi:hypothetical protein